MRTDVRLGGAGRRKACCRSGCHGCPWTRHLDARLTADLEVVIAQGASGALVVEAPRAPAPDDAVGEASSAGREPPGDPDPPG